MGVPVISTDVGIVPETFGEKQKQYIEKIKDINKNDKKYYKSLSNIGDK